jgi:hypothetical protein
MQKTNVMSGQGCDGDCSRCSCGVCGEEPLSRLIRGRHKREYRRYQRRQERGILRQVTAFYRGRYSI